MTYTYPKPLGNGPIVEIFPDVFAVEGKFKLAPIATITRNMTIVRIDGELTLINTVRLQPAEEAELEKLGTVKHVIRLCFAHGCDDPYYVDKYKATMWGLKGHTWPAATGLKVAREIDGGDSPYPGVLEPIVFSKVKPEVGGDAQILVRKEKGILVTSDAIQNYDRQDQRLSQLDNNWGAKMIMSLMGFKGRANTVPIFFKAHSCNGKPSGMKEDFEKLKAVEFDAIIPPHGYVVRTDAKKHFLASQAAINWA